MLNMLVYLCFKVPPFDLFFTFRYDKDSGNHSFLNSSRSPFSSDYCDSVSVTVVVTNLLLIFM